MQIDEIEARDPQPTPGLNPEPDADPRTLDPNGAYDGPDAEAPPDGERQNVSGGDATGDGATGIGSGLRE